MIPQGLPEPQGEAHGRGRPRDAPQRIAAVAEAAGLGDIATESGLTESRARQLIDELGQDVGRVPASREEAALDRALARAAVRLAVKRHAGTVQTIYTVSGPAIVQRGKDLSDVRVVIGTGGALAHSPDPAAILETVLADAAEPFSLRPRAPRLLLDREYILYACGLLGQVEPRQALALGPCAPHARLKKEIRDERTVGT